MNKQEFQALKISEQVDYINERMQTGESLTSACKSVEMTKELSRKFQKNHYKLIDMQFILQTDTTPPSTSPNQQEVATDIISTPKIKSVKKPQETKKIGRPCKLVATTKLTLEVDKKIHKKLKVYCAINELKMNEYITKLLLDNLK